MTCSSGSTCGKCLKNFLVLELLNAFRFFSFFSASLLGTATPLPSELPFEAFCVAAVDLSLSLSLSLLLLPGDEEDCDWAFFEDSLEEETEKMLIKFRSIIPCCWHRESGGEEEEFLDGKQSINLRLLSELISILGRPSLSYINKCTLCVCAREMWRSIKITIN